MKPLSVWAKIYITAAIVAAGAITAMSLAEWRAADTVRFLVYLIGAFMASGLRVTLPGIAGGISVNFVFILIGTMDLGLPQVLCLGFAGTAGQFVLRRKSWRPVQLGFNLASVTLATSASYALYYSHGLRSLSSSVPILLFCSAAVLFVVNTCSVSTVISLTEGKDIWRVWVDNFLWTGSHHLVGAAVAAVFHYENKFLGWEAMVLTIPVIYFVYRSYSLHLGRLREAKQHATEMGDLHWRAIEALALAIDAKDETTHSHLLRVKVYATEIGKEVGMSEGEMLALQAAALLHDIGKLAVPEHIISKPGKLTPEEFDKMKIHPVVGAEILDRVRFPYPVVPIVRSHHEKWNGKGYPEGLAGEDIPLGARILAAVDCLDALASDRQYRRALPLDEAMRIVMEESGKSFDPRIVEILNRRHIELEKMATSLQPSPQAKLSKDLKIERGDAPAAGFAAPATGWETHRPAAEHGLVSLHYMVSSASARREIRALAELTETLAGALTGEETLALLSARLRRFVPHDAIAIYSREGDSLLVEHCRGDMAGHVRTIRMGEGVSGWAAENRKPVLNGNPRVEPGYPASGLLRSALAAPLEARTGFAGVVTLYRNGLDAFSEEEQRTLVTSAPEMAALLQTARASRAIPKLGPVAEVIPYRPRAALSAS